MCILDRVCFFVQDPKQCLDMIEEIMQRYGLMILSRHFNSLYVRDGPTAPCALLEMEGNVNVFKYTNSVCAAVFDLEDFDETTDYDVFVNAIVMEIRNRIAV